MANDKNNPVTPSDQEAELLFRVQMHLSNFVLGYWKHGLAVIGVILLASLVIGVGTNYIRDKQREFSAELARVDRTIPEDAMYQPGPVSGPDSEAFREAAAGYEEVGEGAFGTAKAEAYTKAGLAWLRSGELEKAEEALTEAYQMDAGGIYTFVPGNRLATLLADQGRQAEAMEILRAMARSLKGNLAEEALIALMQLQIQEGEREAFQRSVSEFRTRFAQSPRLERVEALEARAAS